MDFTLSSEQELIRESAREFAAREIETYARDWDRAETMDRGIVAKLATAGFLGCCYEQSVALGLSSSDFIVDRSFSPEDVDRARRYHRPR